MSGSKAFLLLLPFFLLFFLFAFHILAILFCCYSLITQLVSMRKYIATLIFFTLVLIYWLVGYAGTMSYHEQLQMFLFDCQYFTERIAVPGGLADYLSEFLVQFYFYKIGGAIVIAAVLSIIHVLMWMIIPIENKSNTTYSLSFIPSILLWALMGNQDILLSLPVAVMLTLAISLLVLRFKPSVISLIVACIFVPVVYFLCGSTVYIYVLMYLLSACVRKSRLAIVEMPLMLIILILTILLATNMYNVPSFRLWQGMNYYRYPDGMPRMVFVMMIVAGIIPVLAGLVNKVPRLNNAKFAVATFVVVIIAGFAFVRSNFDKLTHDSLEYDYIVRTAKWQKAIDKANKEMPQTPMNVSCLNLALQQTGQMARMFDYFQNGTDGLFLTFRKDFTTSLPAGETFLLMGMVNAAQERFFEAQEAIPNFRQSARVTKRLAETNLINGQYKVARRYINQLKKTLFYRSWAEEAETYLGDDKRIAEHPFWGSIRAKQYDDDFLISDREMPQMLGRLLLKNHQNRMAFEYLMSYLILDRRMENFMDYFQLGSEMGYSNPEMLLTNNAREYLQR